MSVLHFRFEARFFISLILCLVIFFVASSIGSGWALFLASSTLAAASLAVLIPALAMNSIKAKIVGPELLEAGEEIPLRVSFTERPWGRPLLGQLIVKVEVAAETIFDENDLVEAIYLRKFDADNSQLALKCPGLKRGIRRVPSISVETSFPFGMVWCKAVFESEGALLVVLPKTYTPEGGFLRRLSSNSYVPGDLQNSNNGFQSCYAKSVREYNRSDSRRHIHWALSARHGRLMVREFEHEGVPAFDVAIDAGAAWMNSEQFEYGVSAAASLLELGHSMGIHPELFVLEKPIESVTDMPDRCVEIEVQLRVLAGLVFPDPKLQKQKKGLPSSTLRAFESRQKALLVVSPALMYPASAELAESRSTVLFLRIAERVNSNPNGIVEPTGGNELTLSSLEDLQCL